jgi:hypothetical protein
MNPNNLANSAHAEREAVCIWKSGCPHCRKRVELLVSEETCPDTFCCPWCKSRWIFARHVEMDRDDFLALQRSLDEPFRCKCGKCKLSDAKYAGLVHISVR